MIVIQTTVPVDPGQWETAMEYVTDLVDHAEDEAGTVRYHTGVDVTEPNLIRFFEQYEDASAIEEHTESEPYRRFIEALPDLVDGLIETVRIETTDVDSNEFTAMEAVEALD